MNNNLFASGFRLFSWNKFDQFKFYIFISGRRIPRDRARRSFIFRYLTGAFSTKKQNSFQVYRFYEQVQVFSSVSPSIIDV